MNKSYRQGQILRVIRSRPIRTQEDLAKELKTLGILTTQVTLSRDIRDLGLAKTPNGYFQVAPEPGGPSLATMAAEFLQDVRVAQNLLVLKTAPAHAGSLAVSLDKERWPEIVGTLAGDDTILVVTPDKAAAEKLRKKLLEYLAVLE
ncbi:MAG: ArgR family transcriptional regulator [Bryobacteraceae bacterium]